MDALKPSSEREVGHVVGKLLVPSSALALALYSEVSNCRANSATHMHISLLWDVSPPPWVGGRPEKTRGCKKDFPDPQPPQESYWQTVRVPPLA